LFVALVVLSFTLPESVFVGFADVSRFGSGIFMILQIIVLIDFVYLWNENWVKNAEEKKSDSWLYGLLATAGVLLVASIVFWVLFFHWYGAGDCHLQQTFISLTIVFSAVVSLVSVSGFASNGGLLPAASIVGYNTYLLYNALKSDPSHCNSSSGDAQDATQILFGLFFAAASITFSSYSLAQQQKNLQLQESEREGSQMRLLDDPDEENADGKPVRRVAKENDEEEEIEVPADTFFFHFIMILASMYSGMLLTNWAVDLTDNSKTFTLGKQNMWVNMVTQWLVFAMYLWTMVAPAMFPDRDFAPRGRRHSE